MISSAAELDQRQPNFSELSFVHNSSHGIQNCPHSSISHLPIDIDYRCLRPYFMF